MRSPTLEQLLAEELELRAALLRDAREDDAGSVWSREGETNTSFRFRVHLEPKWPMFSALAELRLLERRIYQLREAIRGA